MKKEFAIIRRRITDNKEANEFVNDMSEKTTRGFSLESAGMLHDGYIAWAIMSRPANGQQAMEGEAAELLEAAKKIADMCSIRKCEKCPLKIKGGCAVRIPSELGNLPCNWRIAKEGR